MQIQASDHIRDLGARVYIQQCGADHVYRTDSLDMLHGQAGAYVIPVLSLPDAMLKTLSPDFKKRAVLIRNMDDTTTRGKSRDEVLAHMAKLAHHSGFESVVGGLEAFKAEIALTFRQKVPEILSDCQRWMQKNATSAHVLQK